jgi:nitrite reductase/ring-hydroxylating ferredoxin subunit
VALRVRVCSIHDVVEGELRAFRVKDVTWPVIVTIANGEMFACPGVCPHEDVALVDGYLFGRCRHDAALELRRYPITRIGDDIWVDLL